MSRVIVRSVAQRELAAALGYYREHSSSAAQRFLEVYEKRLDQLDRFPELGREINTGCRGLLLGRFPFLLVYRITGDTVEIIALAHTSRKPNYWTDRVNEEPATYGKEAAIMESTATQLREALYQAGLCLPEEERIALAEELLQSTGPNDLSQEWTAELDRRSRAVKEGTMACITLEELKLKYGRA